MPDFTRSSPPNGTTAERATVQAVLERQAQLLAGGHEAVSRLESRLEPVLASAAPTSRDDARNSSLEPIGVLGSLQHHNRILESLFERVHVLEQRAQL